MNFNVYLQIAWFCLASEQNCVNAYHLAEGDEFQVQPSLCLFACVVLCDYSFLHRQVFLSVYMERVHASTY